MTIEDKDANDDDEEEDDDDDDDDVDNVIIVKLLFPTNQTHRNNGHY